MGYLNEDGLATLVGKVKGQVVQLTADEYHNLPATKETDNKIYFVTDEEYAREIDDEPTLNSDHFVKSGGVYTYTSKIGSGTLTTTAQTIIPAINELKAGLNNCIHTLDVDLGGTTITTADTGWYYAEVPFTLPSGAVALGIAVQNYDASVIPVLKNGNIITLRSPSSRTVPNNRTVRVTYFLP